MGLVLGYIISFNPQIVKGELVIVPLYIHMKLGKAKKCAPLYTKLKTYQKTWSCSLQNIPNGFQYEQREMLERLS